MLFPPAAREPTLSFDFPLSRAAALRRLAAFLPDAGEVYGERRAVDAGPGRHQAVSRLSAALRRRLIAEEEVIAAVLAAQGAAAGAKFLGEVGWRTYWKGWLEQHRAVWWAWRSAVAAQSGVPLPPGYDAATSGTTGIDAFDFWVRELRETGYLHNWARMQFASIWIFTLGLPWALGAAFTFRHFVDADPASNLLSWRWVAGLHSVGKAYLADGDRIARQTGGRFAPKGLATTAHVPRETQIFSCEPLRTPSAPLEEDSLLLLTVEDLSLEMLSAVRALPVRRVVACRALCEGAADIAAVADGMQRAAEAWRAPAAWLNGLDDVVTLAKTDGLGQIVTGYAPVGPTAEALAALRLPPGIRIAEYRRAWDAAAWPHCTRGYFAFAKSLPTLYPLAETCNPLAMQPA